MMSAGSVEEQLSAWIDDELAVHEREWLGARLISDARQRERLARYALIGECLRGSSAAHQAHGLCHRVDRRLAAAEPVQAYGNPGAGAAGWPGRLGGALAALLLVAVVGLGQWQARGPDDTAAGAQRLAAGQAAVRVLPVAVPPLAGERMASYLVHHGRFSAGLERQFIDARVINPQAYLIRTDGAAGFFGDE